MGAITAIKALFSFTNIFSSIKKTGKWAVEHWKELGLALLIGTVTYQNVFETEWLSWFGFRTIPGLEQELEQQQRKLVACETSRKNLKDAVQNTNQQIDKWADLSQDLQRSHDQFIEQLDQMTKQREQATEQILNEPTPQTCQAAIRYLREGAKELQQ